mmetsp:Transcript_32385/g.65944  ORF Transcript_32385/g.65944 Transcript_32385/m.65944 type:complete len:772 (-) Transcript_32385:3612-5927(-)
MVNVTKSNFLEQLRDLLVHLPTASFVSIDEEMTGISLPGSRNSRPNKVELPSERYTNLLKEVPERYAILQVGVAVFHKNPKYKDPSSPSGGGGGGGSPSRARASSTAAEEEQRLLANGGDSDAMEHAFMHREGALNQDELEDLTEREEDNEADRFMAFAEAAASGNLSVRRPGDTDAQAAARAAATAGIRMYEEEEEEEPPQPEYTSRIYNFYIFPNAWSDRELTLNPSTIKFLMENNMDFNKVFEEGVPFTTVKHAEVLKERYFRKHSNNEAKNGDRTPTKKDRVTLTSTNDIAFVARVMANLREWIDSDDSNLHNLINGQEGTSLVLPPCNAFLRRCLYETIEAEYSGLLLERADLSPNAGPTARNQIRVIRLSPEERKRRENRLKVEEWEKLLLGNLGFTTVFQAISDVCNGKVLTKERIEGFLDGSFPSPSVPLDEGGNGRQIPLIVHNGLMDLMFLLTHCHDPSLPKNFEETKMQIRHYFPNVFDTKVMSTEYSDAQIKGGSTALGDLFDTMKHVDIGEKFLFPTISNQESGGSEGQAHEAAWDAYMTGSVFNALGKRILEGKNMLNLDLTFNSLLHESSDSLLREYLGMNMIYMHVSLYTIDLESTSGPAGLHDPLSCGLSIDTTFHVSGITTSVSTRDILQALMAGSEGEGDVILRELKYDIIWIDDTSFFVGTRREEGVALDDWSTLKLIAMHVRNKLHDGLGNVDILSLENYFKKENAAKDAGTGGFTKSIVSLATAPFQLLKRAMSSTSEQEPTIKKRRLN